MLKIRLQRVGRKNIPVFRVVLTDSKNSTKSGKFLEILGSYDPVNDKKEIKADRVKHWMEHGAQLSGTVHNFLVERGVISGKKINVLPKKKPIVKEEKAPAETSAETPAVGKAETPAVEVPTKEAKAEEIKKEEPPKEAEAEKEKAN